MIIAPAAGTVNSGSSAGRRSGGSGGGAVGSGLRGSKSEAAELNKDDGDEL